MEEKSRKRDEEEAAKGEWKLAHLWVSGWRERLRRAGDLVEKERYGGRWEGEIKRIEMGWLDEEIGRMGK